jgi:muramoyltetrapeptide carboxypeptidase LdcA involved in peptidoglycan recycling
MEWRERVGAEEANKISTKASGRGTKVHKICEDYINNEISEMKMKTLMPDLKDHVLILEEVSEYLYGYDRAFFHVTSHLQTAGLAGLRLGRVSDVPENDRPFGEDAEEIARRWCAKTGIDYLGRADIGHDADNRIVPFGLATCSAAP